MNRKTEKQIEFDKVKNIWMEQAITESAGVRISEMEVILDELSLRQAIRETTEAREMIDRQGNPPLQNVSEIIDILEASKKGDCLTPYQLERVEKIIIVIERLRDYLARGKQYDNPIAYYDENLHIPGDLREEISRQIRAEAVDDHATKELGDIRTKISRCEDQMKERAEQIIRSNKEYMADSFYTTRNGRVCVPVKKEYKLKIQGSVIDKSATGSTLFIEPSGVAKYYEELQLLRIEEENEVYKILYTLTAMVADEAEAMYENMKLIEKLDFIFSKGKLSQELDCIEPVINTERRMVLDEARHPLMDKAVNVPLTIRLGSEIQEDNKDSKADDKKRGIVITGPNTGGKTVAIKTAMLNAMMAQCGLHVPCKYADICMNSSYLCDIGDGQNISENLSTFSAHIKNVMDILGCVDRDSFVIMDELGSGTDPAEGMGIAIAILDELRSSGANFIVTTHYPEVKEYARDNEGIINARMTFDRDSLKPTYQMIIGEAGESCAFYIAERLGMPGRMLKRAVAAAYGDGATRQYSFKNDDDKQGTKAGERKSRIAKARKSHINTSIGQEYKIGDSVMIMPDKKIGIVCEPANDKGVLRVQVADRKIWINHKRVKLHVRAEELYPEDYDFSIIFDSVEARKARHDMSRKYTDEILSYDE